MCVYAVARLLGYSQNITKSIGFMVATFFYESLREKREGKDSVSCSPPGKKQKKASLQVASSTRV